eukprot:Gb_08170 [translate_table: standard]
MPPFALLPYVLTIGRLTSSFILRSTSVESKVSDVSSMLLVEISSSIMQQGGWSSLSDEVIFGSVSANVENQGVSVSSSLGLNSLPNIALIGQEMPLMALPLVDNSPSLQEGKLGSLSLLLPCAWREYFYKGSMVLGNLLPTWSFSFCQRAILSALDSIFLASSYPLGGIRRPLTYGLFSKKLSLILQPRLMGYEASHLFKYRIVVLRAQSLDSSKDVILSWCLCHPDVASFSGTLGPKSSSEVNPGCP